MTLIPEKGIVQAPIFAAKLEQFAALQRPGLMATYNGKATSVGAKYAIGLSWSFDGVEWVRDARNPILEGSGGVAWDNDHVKDARLIVLDDVIYMFYAGHDGTKYQIGLAISTDKGRTWERSANNPIITVGSSGAWDDVQVRGPVVLYEPDATAAKRWKLWYTGEGSAEEGRMGYAYAADPEGPWTKHGSTPILSGDTGEWDAYSMGPTSIIKIGSTYYMFYAGKAASVTDKWQGGLATFTDAEGTYTKHASNPLLASQTTRVQSLTADLLTGGTTVTVADTSVFDEGEWVGIEDDDSLASPTITQIVSIDSATQLTLRDGADADYTTAQNAVVRSIYSSSLDLHSLWREGDQWVAVVTCFQFTDELREMCGFYTAPALTGPWTPTVRRGVALELEPERSTWDTAAVENFDAIPIRANPLLQVLEFLRVDEGLNGSRNLTMLGDLNVSGGGFRQTISGFAVDNVGASASQGMPFADSTLSTATNWIPARAGSITGVAVRSSQTVTGGSLTVTVRKNGTDTAVAVTLDTTNTTTNSFTQAKDVTTFSAVDRLELIVTSTSGFVTTATTADIIASLEIET